MAISLGALLVSLQSAPVFGQTWTGNGGSNNAWSNASNWSGGVPNSLSANAVFIGKANKTTALLDADYSLSSLIFSPGSGNNTIEITEVGTDNQPHDNILRIGTGGIQNSAYRAYINGLVRLEADTSFTSTIAATQGASSLLYFRGVDANTYNYIQLNGYNLQISGSGNTEIYSPLIGTGDITKTGTGTLLLNGKNTFAGIVTIDQGTLVVDSGTFNGNTFINNDTLSTGSADTSLAFNNVRVINNGTWNLRFNPSAKAISGTVTNYGSMNLETGTVATDINLVNTDEGIITLLEASTFGKTSIGSLQGAGSVIMRAGTSLELGALNRNNTISGVISGSGALTKIGSGTLTLQGNNTFTGDTTVNAGTLVLSGATASAGTGKLTNNSILQFRNSAVPRNSTITNNGTATFFQGTSAGTTAITNNQTLSFVEGSTLGSATITNTKTLQLWDTSRGDSATIFNRKGAVLDISSRTNSGVLVGYLAGEGNVFLGSKVLTVGGSDLNSEIRGTIQDGGNTGATGGGLTKTGTGTLTLSGYNMYTGKTVVNGGTLALNAAPRNGNYYGTTLSSSSAGLQINEEGNVTVLQDFQIPYNIPVTLSDNAKNGKIASLTLGNSTTVLQNVTLGNAARINAVPSTNPLLALNDANVATTANAAASISTPVGIYASVTYNVGSGGNLSVSGGMSEWRPSGVAARTGAVTKIGTGTLSISGTNTYSGATTVSAGNLLITGSLLPTGTVSVAGGATLSGVGSVGNVSAAVDSIIAPGMNSAPGSGIGTLTVSSLVMSGGSILDFSLGMNGVSDQIIVNGDSNAATFDFSFTGNLRPVVRFGDASTTGLTASDVIGQSYKLVQLSANASTNVQSFNPRVLTGNGVQSINGSFSIVNQGGNSYLTYTPSSFQPVPAPPAAVSLAIGSGVGLVGTALQRLRRRRKSGLSLALSFSLATTVRAVGGIAEGGAGDLPQ